MTKISILGCGWLGLPLAKSLIANRFEVKGSTTSEEKLSVLKTAGIVPFKITLFTDKIEGNLIGFLNDSQILIIDFPPKLNNSDNESFIEKVEKIIPFVEQSSVEKVIFVSSTSVYGEENELITEDTFLNPDTNSGKQLVAVEQLLQKNTHFKTTVVRFGGLIGKDRNPVYFLSGKKNIQNPTASINLIHQEDCINIILKIIETQSWNEIFNAVAPFHPSRKEYYTQKAKEFNLPLPEFIVSKSSAGKIISSEKVIQKLEYHFNTTNYN